MPRILKSPGELKETSRKRTERWKKARQAEKFDRKWDQLEDITLNIMLEYKKDEGGKLQGTKDF